MPPLEQAHAHIGQMGKAAIDARRFRQVCLRRLAFCLLVVCSVGFLLADEDAASEETRYTPLDEFRRNRRTGGGGGGGRGGGGGGGVTKQQPEHGSGRQEKNRRGGSSSIARNSVRRFFERKRQDEIIPGGYFHPNEQRYLGEELFLRASSASSARAACRRLDKLDKQHYGTLFVDCMNALEKSQEEFKAQMAVHDLQFSRVPVLRACPAYYKNNPPLSVHTMWDTRKQKSTNDEGGGGGLLPKSALLGVLSTVLSAPHCSVQLTVWVTDEAGRDAVKRQLQAYLPALTFTVEVIDFTALSKRIARTHPSLTKTLERAKIPLSRLQAPGQSHDGAAATDSSNNPNQPSSSARFSDLVRMFVIAAYGGVYVDCDVVMLRPLTPLLSVDFFYQWSYKDRCNTATKDCSNTAVMYLPKGSQNAEFILQAALQDIIPATNNKHPTAQLRADAEQFYNATVTAFHPQNLWRSLQNFNHTIQLLPSAYFDPLWTVTDRYEQGELTSVVRYGIGNWDEFFTRPNARSVGDQFFPGAFSYHFHNRWNAPWSPQSTAQQLFDYFVQLSRERKLLLLAED